MTIDRSLDRHKDRGKYKELTVLKCKLCYEEFKTKDGRRKRCDKCKDDDAAYARIQRTANIVKPRSTGSLRCHGCNRDLDVGMFYKHAGSSTGYAYRCKECWPKKESFSGAWTRYRIRKFEIQAMLDSQHGLCYICDAQITWNNLKIDHDHSCNHIDKGAECCRKCVRHLLCHRCNIVVGYMESNPEITMKALEYAGIR